LHGVYLLYRGYSKVLVGSLLFFYLYDFINDKVSNAFISSFMSAIDYLKVKHVYNSSHTEIYKSKLIFKGLSLNLLRVVPHFTIIMVGIDLLGKM
jgi:hypothetical protein